MDFGAVEQLVERVSEGALAANQLRLTSIYQVDNRSLEDQHARTRAEHENSDKGSKQSLMYFEAHSQRRRRRSSKNE